MNYALRDKKYVWHPFTQMQDWLREENLVIQRGQGVWLYDVDGNRYLDGVSSLWVTVHGHNHPVLNDALKKQLGTVAHSTFLGLSHTVGIDLAQKLVEITPAPLEKVFFSDNGSTAMEIALKVAYQYWKQKENGRFSRKTKFVTFSDGYHGDTVGAVSLGSIDLFHALYRPLLFDTIKAPYPYVYGFKGTADDCCFSCLNALEDILKERSDEIAAVVIEPEVQGASGMHMTPAGYMKGVEQLVRDYNVLLIIDEVATGFGRTGEMFASEIEQIHPDIMAVAKSLTGGYLPLSATLTTCEVFEAFLGDYQELKTFFHGHTYTANPLGCAVSLANLALYEQENILQNVAERARRFHLFSKKLYELPHVGDIRQKGLMIGIELVKDRDTRQTYPWEQKIGIKVIQEARRHGIIIRPLGNVIVLMPPLCITGKEFSFLLDGTYQSIKTITEKK
ncbi:adenosylmethionine--8-amino-7-oxononanoate transaminase [bacterium]|nr:adenosylmethionine--8-amino-7-oxononanoate transaminase [bacterium]